MTTNNEPAYIDFDIPSIIALRKDYQETIDLIKDCLPDVNWNSRIETVYYFTQEHNIMLHSLKIAELKEALEATDEDEFYEYGEDINEARDVLQGLIELKKLQWTCRNYLDNILKHEVNGRVELRLIDGEWKMPNKQPITYDPNIKACIISTNLKEI